jgi:hypothetical protein
MAMTGTGWPWLVIDHRVLSSPDPARLWLTGQPEQGVLERSPGDPGVIHAADGQIAGCRLSLACLPIAGSS